MFFQLGPDLGHWFRDSSEFGIGELARGGWDFGFIFGRVGAACAVISIFELLLLLEQHSLISLLNLLFLLHADPLNLFLHILVFLDLLDQLLMLLGLLPAELINLHLLCQILLLLQTLPYPLFLLFYHFALDLYLVSALLLERFYAFELFTCQLFLLLQLQIALIDL